MGKPIVYGPAYSTYARTVLMTLKEKKVDFDLVHVDMLGGEHKQPTHLKRHPFGKVPSFEHNGMSFYEVNAIVHYIDDAFPGRKLEPNDLERRTRSEQIISVVDSYAYPCLIGKIMLPRAFADKVKGPDEAAIAAAVPEAERCLKAIEDLMVNPDPFLVGRELSHADISVAPVLAYFVGMPEGPRTLAKTPKLEKWWDTFQNHPSFVATVPQM